MKIPSTLKIAGRTWKVVTSEDMEKQLSMGNWLGRIVQSTGEIHLSVKYRDQDGVSETLIHEILHVLIDNAGLSKTVLSDKDEEEAVVEALCCGLYQVLKDNDLWQEKSGSICGCSTRE